MLVPKCLVVFSQVTTNGVCLYADLSTLPFFLSLAPAWHVVQRQEGVGFTRGSLNAIKEQYTDRMLVVNRGKQGRAEDTVTLSVPHDPPTSSSAFSPLHHTFTQFYLQHTALPMAPHIFQFDPAFSAANSCLTASLT